MKIICSMYIIWVWIFFIGFLNNIFGISYYQKKEWFDKVSQNDGNIYYIKDPQSIEDIQENFAFWDYISNYPHEQSIK